MNEPASASESPETSRRPVGRRLENRPELDGVRAVAVLAVLGFHAGVSWLTGGYLGVSVFFTLSGFLITSLILVQAGDDGSVDLGAFYARRLRRLMPASLLTLAIIAIATTAGVFAESTRLRNELLGALLQVLNWVELFSQRTYAELFSDPSPVAHFWSLGIEEQFYWVWPMAIAWLMRRALRRGRDRREIARSLVVMWVIAAVSAPVTAALWSSDAAYFATWARAAEVLSGAVLAAWLATRTRAVPPWWRWVGVASLAVIAASCLLTPAGRGWPYEGALPVFSLVSAGLLLGLAPASGLRTALGWSPLVWIGRRSYGIYLYHWPIMLVLDERRAGLDGIALLALRFAVTFTLAAVSYRLIEEPIRHGRRIRGGGRPMGALLASMVTVAGLAAVGVGAGANAEPAPLVIPAASTTAAPTTTTTVPASEVETGVDGQQEPGVASTTTTTTLPPITSVAFLGDSVANWMLRDGAEGFDRPDISLINGAIPACDGMRDMGPGRDRFGNIVPVPDDCQPWDTWYPLVLDNYGGDVVVLVIGNAVVIDRDMDGTWKSPCSANLDWYRADVAARVSLLQARGNPVIGVLPAHPGERSIFVFPDDYQERETCVRTALAETYASLGVPVIDFDELLCVPDCDEMRRTDGLHVDPDRAAEALNWLVAEVLETVEQERAGP